MDVWDKEYGTKNSFRYMIIFQNLLFTKFEQDFDILKVH